MPLPKIELSLDQHFKIKKVGETNQNVSSNYNLLKNSKSVDLAAYSSQNCEGNLTLNLQSKKFNVPKSKYKKYLGEEIELTDDEKFILSNF